MLLVVLLALTGATARIPAADAQTSAQTALASLADGTTDIAADADADQADLSADGNVVAFESDADNLVDADVGTATNVYVRDRETGATELVSLTPDDGLFPGGAREPSVSADGRYVAFTGDSRRQQVEVVTGDLDVERLVFASTEAPGGLFIVSDGDDVEHVPGTGEGDTQPVFSPDQSRIAFVRDGDIWTIAVDGSDAQQLTGVEVTETDTDTAPSWSPDGVRIAYARNSEELRIVEVDTGADQLVDLNGGFGPVVYVGDPAWSPDGQQIAFAGEFSDGNTSGEAIYVYSGEGPDGPRISNPTGFELGSAEGRPAWSPNGGAIVFEVTVFAKTSDADPTALAVANPNASNGSASSDWLTYPDLGVHDRQPTWTSDSQRIVFSSTRGGPEDPDDLYVIPAGGVVDENGNEDEVPLLGVALPDAPGPRTWPSFGPTDLGPDTPATLTATVTGEPPPSGPVEFRFCGVQQEGTPDCSDPDSPNARVGPRVALSAVDDSSAAASLDLADLTPPADIGTFGERCWDVVFLGDDFYAGHANDTPERMCHTTVKDSPNVTFTVDAFSDDGELVSDFTLLLSGSSGFPTGVATVWRCGPAEVTAAGCPEGGERVVGPVPLEVGGSQPTFFTVLPAAAQDLQEVLPTGRYCYRVEYSGNGAYQRTRDWSPWDCVTHDADDNVDANDNSDVDIVSDPGTVDFDAPLQPGDDDDTISVYATQTNPSEFFPVDFYLCGPEQVTRYGCESGGQLIAEAEQFDNASGFETVPFEIAAPDQEGVYCWRIEQPALDRDYTDTTESCFAVEEPYEVVVDEGVHVYVRDRAANETVLVSVDEEGVSPPFGESSQPSISDDGMRVAFVSDYPLVEVEGQSLFGQHVYVRDLAVETTTWVSVTNCEGSACAFEVTRHSPAISGDGSAVAFVSSAFDLAAVLPDGTPWDGGPGTPQVFVRDLADGVTTVESVGDDGELLEVDHGSPTLSSDGQRLAFIRDDFVPGTESIVSAVYWRDREAQETALASVTVDGGPLGGYQPHVLDAAISGDGNTVVFSSNARNLVADDPCADVTTQFCGPFMSVWARDLLLGTTERVSLRDDGGPAVEGSTSYQAAVDTTGDVIAFTSDAYDLVADVEVPVESYQVYVRERPTGLEIEPAALEFGGHRVGGSPAQATATVRNIGGRTVQIDESTIAGPDSSDFSVSGGTCFEEGSLLLAPGETCTVVVTFAPQAEGVREATLSVSDEQRGVEASIDLRGEGTVPRLEIDPEEIAFGERPVGSTSPPETVTVTNDGSESVAVDTVALGGPDPGAFLIDEDTCSDTVLAVGDSCTITVRHRPTASRAQTAVLLISHDGEDSPGMVRLSGGVAGPGGGELTVTPNPVDFGVVTVGSSSAPRIVTVTNTGDSDVAITDFTLSGVARTRFRPVPGNDTCSGATLEPGRGCGISFQMIATAAGAPRARLQINSDAAEPADPVILQGLVPLLEIAPTLGPPGFVPEVTGRFFPPNTDLTLRWVSGIGSARVRTDTQGELTARMLVFRNDRIGPRFVVAERLGTQWAAAEFLVVPASLQPGDFTSRD